jgi:hypothetical protein
MVNKNKKAQAQSMVQVYDSDIDLANDVAIARVMASIEGEDIEAVGVAKRHPDDKANPKVAALIAYGRAVSSLASKIEKRAAGAVKHADDMARNKELQAAKKTKTTKATKTKKAK